MPPSRVGWPGSPGPRPTGARGWPSSPARWGPAAAGSRPVRPRSAGSPSSSPPPAPAPPRPSRSSPGSRAAWPSRRRARRASTTPTRRPRPGSPRPRPRSSGWSPAEREAERDRSSATARIEALELSLRRKDGAATLLAAADADHAVVGTVAALLQVTGGHEAAVAAALGWASEALAVPSADHAARAIASLRDSDGGRAALLVGGTASPSDPGTWPALDGSAVWARDVVRAPDSVRPAVEQLLERVALVPTAAHAVALVSRGEGITAVTADGDVFGPGWARGGSSAGESLLELQAAVDETRTTLDAATATAERARFALGAARQRAREVGGRGRGGARGAARVRRPDGGRRRAAGWPRCRDATGLAPRPTAPSGPSPRRAWRSSAIAPSSRGSPRDWPRPRPRPPRRARTPPPTSATASSWPPAGPAPPRPSCASPCAPARSGPGRSRAGPTRSRARRATSSPPASGCASGASAAGARPSWPPPCTRPPPTPSTGWRPRWRWRPPCATPPRPTGSSATGPAWPCVPS